jgi:hypothetical protein
MALFEYPSFPYLETRKALLAHCQVPIFVRYVLDLRSRVGNELQDEGGSY